MKQILQSTFRPHSQFKTIPKPIIITKIITENDMIKSFIFNTRLIHAQPGQFVMLWLPKIKEGPFSIAHNNPLTITIYKRGPLTKTMHQLNIGDRIWMRGPYGKGFNIYKTYNKPLLIGGGYGSAPLAFFAKQLLEKNIKPTIILGGKSKKNIIGTKTFQMLGINPIHTTNDGSFGIKGFITNPTKHLLKIKKINIIYGIGPNPMLDTLLQLSTQHKIPAELSYESIIKCSIGNCGICECKGKLLCVEGPVLRFGI